MQKTDELVSNNISKYKSRDFVLSDFAGKYGALIVIVFLLAINSAVTPNFVKINTLWNIIIHSTTVMIVALGMTLVISSGGIDISVGAIMAVSAMVVAKLLDYGLVGAILAALLISASAGMFNGFIISYFNIQPIIVTLSFMIAGRGIAQLLNDGWIVTFVNPDFCSLALHRFWGVVPIQLLMIVIFVLIFYIVVKNMTFGRYVQAMGDNLKASRLSGVNTFLITIAVYALNGLMAGIAGILVAARSSAADANSVGLLMELDAIAAVAIGGTPLNGGKANIMGTVLGALIMQIITITINMNDIPFEYSLVLKTIIIILAVYVQRERSST